MRLGPHPCGRSLDPRHAASFAAQASSSFVVRGTMDGGLLHHGFKGSSPRCGLFTSMARPRLQLQFVDHLAAVVRIFTRKKSKVAREILHRLILGGVDRGHRTDAARSCDFDEMLHQ